MSMGVSATGLTNGALHHAQAQAVHAAIRSVVKNLLSVDDSMMDLPLRQLKVCTTLYRQSHSMSEISRELGLSPSAVTQVSNRLERRGLIERIFQDDDRRVRKLRLTRKGHRLMRSREEKQLSRIAATLHKVSPKELQQIMAGLHLLTQGCESPRGKAP
ncbi:MAG TPA: MarR family transcriptional regulator [Lacipirellulaceae bacterium]|nr:MarR family transcriptional regulator [Lacipirellulaceae bacterium]